MRVQRRKVDREYVGKMPYVIDNGELIPTFERFGDSPHNTIYLTYVEYMKLKDLADCVHEKCVLLDKKKELEITRLRLCIKHVITEERKTKQNQKITK
jgi:hypothetical protein